MKIISHRGNTDGPGSFENIPEQIDDLLREGFHVEIDVWMINSKFYLGHDFPTHPTNLQWLIQKGLICHAKNLDALKMMINYNIHCFWHENDDYTFTSLGIPVVHCSKSPFVAGLGVLWIEPKLKFANVTNLWGICTDYPYKVQQSIEK